MSFFTTTASMQHRTPLPPSTTLDKCLSIFRNHDLLLRLDPEFAHYESTPAPPSASDSATKYYKVTDHMHTLPRGLWDTTVSFDAEITDIENGVKWVIKAPLGLVQLSFWRIVPAEETDKYNDEPTTLCLVEDIEIRCSRLLLGTVKGKCEENWRGVHGRYMEHVQAVA